MKFETIKTIREKEVRRERISKIYRKRATLTKAQLKAIEILESKWIHCVREKRIFNSVSFYLIDIYLPEHNMCIEIDGSIHDTEEQKEKDRIRDEFLKRNGYWVIRIKDEDVYFWFWQKIKSSIIFRNKVLNKYWNTIIS